MSIRKVLVVDDDPTSREFMAEVLGSYDLDVEVLSDGAQALRAVASQRYDLIFTDMRMPGASGLEILVAAQEAGEGTYVVVMTAYGSVESAVEAMKLGAFDYLTKPFSPDQLDVVLRRAQERSHLLAENRYLRAQLAGSSSRRIIGADPQMRKVLETIQVVAPSRATVLIEGESGTGKELVANEIHRLSPRAAGPLVKVNCAALPETLLESELFGHEKGAFTGALAQRPGKLELADGGTVLLDEVSEMSPALQAKVLRALQEREIDRIGGVRPIKVDVRILASTNKNLEEEVRRGNFRVDLFYRLNVVRLRLPALRERRGDIPLLANHFLHLYARENSSPMCEISPEAMRLLVEYSWPGNVRELENCIEQAVVLHRERVLRPEHLSFVGEGLLEGRSFCRVGMTVKEMERELILATLEETGGNRTRAAEKLGISVRSLRNKLAEYREQGIRVPG